MATVKSTVVDWYRDRAEWFGQRVIARMHTLYNDLYDHDRPDDDYTVELAKLAGHFGALVLGYASLEGKRIFVMDYRVLSEPIERYDVAVGVATSFGKDV